MSAAARAAPSAEATGRFASLSTLARSAAATTIRRVATPAGSAPSRALTRATASSPAPRRTHRHARPIKTSASRIRVSVSRARATASVAPAVIRLASPAAPVSVVATRTLATALPGRPASTTISGCGLLRSSAAALHPCHLPEPVLRLGFRRLHQQLRLRDRLRLSVHRGWGPWGRHSLLERELRAVPHQRGLHCLADQQRVFHCDQPLRRQYLHHTLRQRFGLYRELPGPTCVTDETGDGYGSCVRNQCHNDSQCSRSVFGPFCIMDAGVTSSCGCTQASGFVPAGEPCNTKRGPISQCNPCFSNADCPPGELCAPDALCRPHCDDGGQCDPDRPLCDTGNLQGQNGMTGEFLGHGSGSRLVLRLRREGTDCPAAEGCTSIAGRTCAPCYYDSDCASGGCFNGTCLSACDDAGACPSGGVTAIPPVAAQSFCRPSKHQLLASSASVPSIARMARAATA